MSPHGAAGQSVAEPFDDTLGEEGWEVCPFNTPQQGFRWRESDPLGQGGFGTVYMWVFQALLPSPPIVPAAAAAVCISTVRGCPKPKLCGTIQPAWGNFSTILLCFHYSQVGLLLNRLNLVVWCTVLSTVNSAGFLVHKGGRHMLNSHLPGSTPSSFTRPPVQLIKLHKTTSLILPSDHYAIWT